MLEIIYSGQFKRDVKRMTKRKKDMSKLKTVIDLLVNEQNIPASLKDHSLVGNWKPRRELHIESDWLLIYKIENASIIFDRTGSHSDIF